MDSHRRDTTASAVSPIEAYFAQLGQVQSQPLLKRATGSIRFDVIDDSESEHWHVEIDHGDVAVSKLTRPPKDQEADAVVKVDGDTFAGMVIGTVNAFAALLRGDVVVDGDLGLVLAFQRLFPSPPSRSMARAGSTGGTRE